MKENRTGIWQSGRVPVRFWCVASLYCFEYLRSAYFNVKELSKKEILRLKQIV